MSKKASRVAALIDSVEAGGHDPHYLAYFDQFNKGQYYDAHDVLEQLWLIGGKSSPDYAFYKGLIQLAGAFVHLQKNRPQPAVALFNLAEANLRRYAPLHKGICIDRIVDLIADWREYARAGSAVFPPITKKLPSLELPVADAREANGKTS